MCGIAGAIARTPSSFVADFTRVAIRELTHRGPDGAGAWRSGPDAAGPCDAASLGGAPRLALGHRRLSIVDLAGGAQPMANEDGRIWVTFNGEIYNHAELRVELEARGHRFRSRSDTETLVHGWEEWGESLFGRLNGIFAVAIADLREDVVVLARDPLGVKPLYVGSAPGATWWSSELAAATAAGGHARRVSADALKLFLTFRFIPSPQSIFEGVWKVPPGHLVRVRTATAGAAPEFVAYPSAIRSSAQPRDRAEWREALSGELDAAVERQLMADVPVASLLSGGVDSTRVTQIMTDRLPYRPATFGIGFRSDGADSEALAAALAARELGVPHDTVWVDDDAYIGAWPEAVAQVGEPIANSGGLLVHQLCQRVALSHKVVLTGQGADEPLGGYPRHMIERLVGIGRVAPRLAAGLVRLGMGRDHGARLGRALAAPTRLDRYVQIFSVLPAAEVDAIVRGASAGADDLARATIARWVTDEGDDPLNALLRVDTRMSLADDLLIVADHFSMRASVELRVPFLDLRFVELAERMPSRYKLSKLGERKWLYREAVAKRLPAPTARRLCGVRARLGRKRGFTTPLARWFTAADGPLARPERWIGALDRLDGLSPAAVRDMAAGETAYARQRAALFALATWSAAAA